MLLIVISIVLMILTGLLVLYSFDSYSLYKNHEEFFVKQPDLYDLKESTEKYEIQQYIDDVICPSYLYFKETKEIKDMQKEEEGFFIHWIVLGFPSILLFSRGLRGVCQNVKGILLLIISIAIFVLIALIEDKIYRKSRLSACEFSETKEDILKSFSYDNDSNMDEEAQKNILLIRSHRYFIERIKKSVGRRYFIRKCLTSITFIIYMLFFMRTDA